MPAKYSGARGGDRLWPKVVKGDECWKWTGQLDRDGYGKLRTFEQRGVRAHAYAWWLATGHWPELGEVVAHTCDVLVAPGDTSYRACVRNDEIGTYELDGVVYERRGHLWLTTQSANSRDKTAKGRAASGDRNGSRLYPERRPRGDNNWTRQRPELVARGEQNAAAKLTEQEVLEMRRLSSEGIHYKTLATMFSIANPTAWEIIARKSWRHI